MLSNSKPYEKITKDELDFCEQIGRGNIRDVYCCCIVNQLVVKYKFDYGLFSVKNYLVFLILQEPRVKYTKHSGREKNNLLLSSMFLNLIQR